VGLTAVGFYPSTPVRPSFAFSEDVLRLFHAMYMRGPSSKMVFCAALESFVQKKGPEKVRSDLSSRS
jgi:hypothetical protein